MGARKDHLVKGQVTKVRVAIALTPMVRVGGCFDLTFELQTRVVVQLLVDRALESETLAKGIGKTYVVKETSIRTCQQCGSWRITYRISDRVTLP